MAKTNGVQKATGLNGYQRVRILGTGAHSTIWLVRDPTTGQTRALKSVLREGEHHDRFLEQTINEYNVANRIDHPNVRKIYEIRRIRKLVRVRELQLLMEYCPGRSVQEQRPRSLLGICSVFAQTAHALQKINENGFVHADMKPDNIIVDEEGNVKIIDLGQACPIGTIKRRIQGSPDFIAPEQIRLEPLDARTDVFNFGASLYWALSGKYMPSLMAGGGIFTPAKITPPADYNPEIPPLLNRLVMDCIQMRPEDRPKTMRDVIGRMVIVLQKELQPSPAGDG
ncbi:MAG: serine/threonine protein kinase [Phycisphaerae bacterium]|nr:serine/threonine protein kinase [Phycisphaerae bacterium]